MVLHRRLAALSWLLTACVGTPALRPPEAVLCARAPGTLVAFDSLRAEALAGDWRLTLQSVTRPKATTRGPMHLAVYRGQFRIATPQFRRLPDSVSGRMQYARFDFDSIVGWEPWAGRRRIYGWSDIDLGAVGASNTGRPSSRRPGAPGLLLWGRDLRVAPPPLGFYQFDGFSTTLHIEQVSDQAMVGSWEVVGFGERIDPNTGITIPWPGGRFCAERHP